MGWGICLGFGIRGGVGGYVFFDIGNRVIFLEVKVVVESSVMKILGWKSK